MNAKELAVLGRTMMDEHGLKDWKFGYLCSNSSYGITQFKPKKDSPPDNLEYDLGIAVSHTLAAVNSDELTKDVLLHEIAHARIVQEYIGRMTTRLKYERLHCEMASVSGHSNIWRMEYLKIGGCGMECWSEWNRGPVVTLPRTYAEERGLTAIQYLDGSVVVSQRDGTPILE